MNKINMDQIKSMYAMSVGDYFSIERYHQLITMIRVYSDMSHSNDIIKFSGILRDKIMLFTHDLSLQSYGGYKKFHKTRKLDNTIISFI